MYKVILVNDNSNVEYRDNNTIGKPNQAPHGLWAVEDGKVIIFNEKWGRENTPDNWRDAPYSIQKAMKEFISAIFEQEVLDE